MTTYTLPKLPYSTDALEPHIDARTMEIHHGKHHQAYVNNLNVALESAKYKAPEDVFELIADLKSVPESIRSAVRNNGGGHANHTFFWELLNKKGAHEPVGQLKAKLIESFTSFDKFKEQFKQAALSRFGSGWAWLCLKTDGTLCICSTPNQDNPLMQGFVDCPGMPIVGLDVWEHAYYLAYQNRRAEYIDAFWHVLDWNVAEANYQKIR